MSFLHSVAMQVKHFSTRTYTAVLSATEDVPCQQGSAKAKESRGEGFVCAHRERVIILWSFLEVYTLHSINSIVWVWWKEPDNKPGLTGRTKAYISMCLVLTPRVNMSYTSTASGSGPRTHQMPLASWPEKAEFTPGLTAEEQKSFFLNPVLICRWFC